MNYFIPLNKTGINKKDAVEALCAQIKNDKNFIKNILIIGNNYFTYISGVKWELYDDNNQLYKTSEIAFTFEEIFSYLQKIKRDKKNLSQDDVKKFLQQWSISVYNENNVEILNKEKVINLLDLHFYQVFNVELDNSELKKELTVYLNAGLWYVLDNDYIKFINRAFEKLYMKDQEKIKKVYQTYNLNQKMENECAYNNFFEHNKLDNKNHVILADKVLISNIEICDLIVFDDKNTYLICNKTDASGSAARDLLNQISAAARIIYQQDQVSEFKEYYQKLIEKGRIKEDFISETEFYSRLKKPIFVSSYIIEDLTVERNLVYSKLLSIQLEKELKELGLDFYVTSPLRYLGL